MTPTGAGPRLLAGRYELQTLLGRGGAGEVWRGVDTRLGRDVAVKLVRIPPALDDDERAETHRRVMREARAAARIRHPAAVTMYDVLDEDGELCLVMELVEAPDLGRLVQEGGPLAPAVAARIGLDVLDALEAAHERRLVHRDVKPSNVLVPDTGPARLTDFGTAVIAGEDRLTATGMVFGSPAYMAPEQAVDIDVGPAADLWALGATLYQAVEGHPPFSGPTPVATMYAALNSDPRPVERAGPLAPVIERLLVRDIAARADAREARELLEAVAGGRTAILPVAAWTGGDHEPHESMEAEALGVDPIAPQPEPPGAGAWGDPATGRSRPSPAGGRSPALLAAVVAILLVGAVVLASVLTDDARRDTAPPAEVGADLTPTPVPTPLPAVPPPAAPGTPTPTVVPTTPTPDEDEADEADDDEADDDDRPGQGQGAGQGQGQGQGQGAGQGQGSGQGAVGLLPPATVPGDWVTFAPDDAPYVVAHPAGWGINRLDATRTDISDPDSSAYLRLDWTDDPAPDALANWVAFEPQFAQGREGYERIRMEPTTFKGEDAALWEYRYVRGSTTLRAYNLNVSGGTYGYALNFQTRESEWEAMEPLFGAFAESYTIPG
ncbi:hypothetical protein BH23ACT9_BH23ACT9_15420 [soil metagenome]